MCVSQAAERGLILLAAGTAARRAARRGEALALVRRVRWEDLAETLRSRRLLATVGPRLLELQPATRDSEFAAMVQDALEEGRRHGGLLALITLRLAAGLADAGIACSSLKGPLFAEAVYGDVGRRRSGDIDLLVAAEDLRRAADVIGGLGYLPPRDHERRDGLPLLHYSLVHPAGELPPIELHWRVHWYERRFARERLLPGGGEPPSWRPAPADELVALLLYYARDGFLDLRLACDLGAWWDRFATELPARGLADQIAAYPELRRVIEAACRVGERTVGIPAQRLISRESGRLRGALAMRLANPHPTASVPQLHAEIGLLDGLLAPPGGFPGYLRRQLFPPRAVLASRAQGSGDRRGSTQAGHSVRVVARYVLTLKRLAARAKTAGRDGPRAGCRSALHRLVAGGTRRTAGPYARPARPDPDRGRARRTAPESPVRGRARRRTRRS